MMVETITNAQLISETSSPLPKRGEAASEEDFAAALAMNLPASEPRTVEAEDTRTADPPQEPPPSEPTEAKASTKEQGQPGDGESAQESGPAAADGQAEQAPPSAEEATENERSDNGSTRPDSGQGRTVVSPMSVDGRENGVPPGASTEAAVSAPTTDGPVDGRGSIRREAGNPRLQIPSPEAAAEAPPLPPTPLPDGAETDPLLDPEAKQETGLEETKLSARVLSARPAATTDWFAPGDRGVVFETGLAEQIVRALTDQFRESRFSDSAPASGAKMSADTPSAGGQGPGQTQGAGLKEAFQTILTPAAETEEATGSSVGRLMNIIRNHVGQRHSQLTVQLEPPELGRMRIDVRLTDSHMRLNITTETDQARHLISQRFEVLRSALESQGITVSRFDVQTRSFPQEPHQGQDGRHPSDHPGQSFNMNHQDGRQSDRPASRPYPPADQENEDPVGPGSAVTRTAFRRRRMGVNLVA